MFENSSFYISANARPNQRGLTALMLAAVKGNKEVVDELLLRGADTTLKCKVRIIDWSVIYSKVTSCRMCCWVCYYFHDRVRASR